MAKLSAFKTNSDAINQGEWVRPGEEYDDLEVRVRGFTDAYYDAQAAKLRRAAVPFGGDISKIPSALRRQINVDCLNAHVVLDVRNLKGDDGKDIKVDQFRELLRDPDYAELVIAVYKAAGRVGQQRAADLEDAAGN